MLLVYEMDERHVRPGDEVVFTSNNSPYERRGKVLTIVGGVKAEVLCRSAASRSRDRVFCPRMGQVLQVFRNGFEEYRLHGVTPAVPAPHDEPTSVDRDRPPLAGLKALPATDAFSYKRGDVVTFVSRSVQRSGEVVCVVPAACPGRRGCFDSITVQIPEGRDLRPPTYRIQRVWRDGRVVAVHPEYLYADPTDEELAAAGAR